MQLASPKLYVVSYTYKCTCTATGSSLTQKEANHDPIRLGQCPPTDPGILAIISPDCCANRVSWVIHRDHEYILPNMPEQLLNQTTQVLINSPNSALAIASTRKTTRSTLGRLLSLKFNVIATLQHVQHVDHVRLITEINSRRMYRSIRNVNRRDRYADTDSWHQLRSNRPDIRGTVLISAVNRDCPDFNLLLSRF